MTNEKQAMAAKIKALLAKTIENGATEHEAMAAMAKARQLMDAHNIGQTEVEVRAEGFEKWLRDDVARDEKEIFDCLWAGIAALTETRIWSAQISYGRRADVLFGAAGDVAFAKWLTEALVATVRREVVAFLQSLPAGSNKVLCRRSFVAGMGSRMTERMKQEAAASRQATAQASTGRGLVVVNKQALVNAELARQGVKLGASRSRGRRLDQDSVAAGKAAGSRATWSRPVNSGAGVKSLT